MRSHGWIAALLMAGVSAVFYQVATHELVRYDDYEYIVQNPHLRDNLIEALRSAFQPYGSNWIPITWMSLWIDYALYGLEPAGYHLTNVALHAFSTVLLFLTLARMTKATWPSAFVAAVFAIHPLHVESVAWATQRKDTLSGAFWMLTLWSYVYYSERPDSIRRYLLVLLCLVLGLLAKPIVVTLPFVLLLLDYWPLDRLRRPGSGARPQATLLRRALVEKLPMFALVAAVCSVTLIVQREAGAMQAMESVSAGWRIANALVSYGAYVWLAVWPSALSVFYPHPMESIAGWRVAAAVLFLAGTTLGLMRTAAARPYAIVGWLWYLGTLVPVIGLVQVGMQARADRYMYLPLIGLSILTAWGVSELADRWRVPRPVLGTAALAAILGLATTAWFQVGTWRNTEALYRHALAVTDRNYLAHKGLGNELLRQHRAGEARRQYSEAIRLAPDWPPPRLGLADVALAEGQIEQGLRLLREELESSPGNYEVIGRYGLALGLLGRHAEARLHIGRALKVLSGSAELHRAMAEIEAALGNSRAAVHHGHQALRLSPSNAEAANNLAWTLATCADPDVRDPDEAIRLLEATARNSDDPAMLDTLAAAYAAAGRFGDAIATARRALHLAAGQGAADDLDDIRYRLDLYRQGKPYVELKAGGR